jgi:hypothetical protein
MMTNARLFIIGYTISFTVVFLTLAALYGKP